MRRLLGIAAVLLLLSLLGAAGVVYRWTCTPFGRLDLGAAVLARLMASSPPMQITPEARLASHGDLAAHFGAPEPLPLPRVEDREITGPDGAPLPLRIYWPEAPGPLPFYLYLHGGGWWLGHGFPSHARNTHVAARSGAIVVAVDYRLTPEHPFPAALDDCRAALGWIHDHAAELGGDPRRIAVGGGSAGANLAAALALRVRDEGGPPIAFQVLIVPPTDLVRHDWPSYEEMGEDYLLRVSDIDTMIAAYVPDPALRASPYASPLRAHDLGGLPPALVVTAQFDPLRDQGEAYARRLQAAGVPVRLHREPGALHGFAGSPARARHVDEMAADALREALRRPPSGSAARGSG